MYVKQQNILINQPLFIMLNYEIVLIDYFLKIIIQVHIIYYRFI